jgi:hypothetical protein
MPCSVVECTKEINEKKLFNNKIEMIYLEFSDIYGVMQHTGNTASKTRNYTGRNEIRIS